MSDTAAAAGSPAPASPTSTSTRLTTIARTGCLMKISVNERMSDSVPVARVHGDRRLRSWPRRALSDRDQRGVAQLERARSRDLLACGQPASISTSSPSIAPIWTGRSVRARLALLVRRDHEHVIALRSLAQRARRNGDRVARRADRHADAHRSARARARCRAFDLRARPWRCAWSDRRARRSRRSSRESGVASWRRRRRRCSPSRRPAATCCATAKSTCDGRRRRPAAS